MHFYSILHNENMLYIFWDKIINLPHVITVIPQPFYTLLQKTYLSQNCILPVTKILSHGVNQFQHCHSTETETHIHFCPKSVETFDILSFSSEKSKYRHMLCIWQHMNFIKNNIQLSIVSNQISTITNIIRHNLIPLNNEVLTKVNT